MPPETFHVSDEVRAYFQSHTDTLAEKHAEWSATFSAWKASNADLAKQLEVGLSQTIPSNLLDSIPEFEADSKAATRASGGAVLQPLAEAMPLFVSGSADLYGSTKNYIKGAGDFGRADYKGRNIWFGIREHAMGAILNGIAYDGLFRPSGATFAVFADYIRPSVRLAALAHLPVLYIFTHDSVGVGEDGPTHQPVETGERAPSHSGARCHSAGRCGRDGRSFRRRVRTN